MVGSERGHLAFEGSQSVDLVQDRRRVVAPFVAPNRFAVPMIGSSGARATLVAFEYREIEDPWRPAETDSTNTVKMPR